MTTPAPRGDDVDAAELGGDRACWAGLVCPACDAVLDAGQERCPRCDRARDEEPDR